MSDALVSARREQVVAQLGAAWAAESIDEAEMERRMALAFAAQEASELDRLVVDLPSPRAAVAAPEIAPRVAPGAQLAPFRRVALGAIDEKVLGVVPPRVEFGVRFGSIELDLTHAIFVADVTEIVLDVVLGNVEMKLPPDATVEMFCNGVLSSVEYRHKGAMVPSSGRVVRITGQCLLGNVEVRTDGPRVRRQQAPVISAQSQ